MTIISTTSTSPSGDEQIWEEEDDSPMAWTTDERCKLREDFGANFYEDKVNCDDLPSSSKAGIQEKAIDTKFPWMSEQLLLYRYKAWLAEKRDDLYKKAADENHEREMKARSLPTFEVES
ncbi:hypothetical protein HYFRA_00012892 [Hymenoscyphus fraxineus]|uniref:Uncharacterized protein n=1 Tax=Hymenoscyphus fraxineus TaxID=746836 RepID=A0A9N9PX26_9HELO|nr:hypothetical protein HYFRA_00012892 [Hymenoscyphus fraxineus]